MPIIDLRSDTVTRPTKAMMHAMTTAELGDDVLGDDPTVIALQEKFAALLGKEAACFVPSGTMANQAAIRAQTEPGDEIICHDGSHILHYEGGGPAALSGCMCRTISSPDGLFDEDAIEPLIRPGDAHFSRSRLLSLENTHNRNGGTVWPLEQIARVTAKARSFGLRAHLDGARIWNACAASGVKPAEYAKHFDTVSACFSKGLGCPIGSAVAGDRETIRKVLRARKLFGGAMRQAGLIAAAAIYALDHHRDRLSEDHANARMLADGLSKIKGVLRDASQPNGPQTNIVFFEIAPDARVNGPQLQERLAKEGVLVLAGGPRRVRAVLHLDVPREAIAAAVDAVRRVMA